MVRKDPHILHHQVGLQKYVSIDPLQDKMRLGGICHRDQESIINIATAKGANIFYLARIGEFLGDGRQAIQCFSGLVVRKALGFRLWAKTNYITINYQLSTTNSTTYFPVTQRGIFLRGRSNYAR